MAALSTPKPADIWVTFSGGVYALQETRHCWRQGHLLKQGNKVTIYKRLRTLLSPPSLVPESRSTGQPAPKEIPKDPDAQCCRTNRPAEPPGSEVWRQHPAQLSGLLTSILVKHEQPSIIRHLRKAANMKDSQMNKPGKKHWRSRLCRRKKTWKKKKTLKISER